MPMPAAQTPAGIAADRLYRRILWHILPLLLLSYAVAYIDRVNIGLAKPQMQADLGLSATVFGIGAGIFFIGYLLCEVPSNLLLHRVGARFWIARIMISWGVVAALLAAVAPIAQLLGPGREPGVFLALRFLLGAAEAGFFPGLVLYFNYWLPPERQGRVFSILMAAQPLSFVVGLPLSGWLLDSLDGVLGHAGWQWMIMLEAIPAIILGIVVARTLVDRPHAAAWLTRAQADWVQAVAQGQRGQRMDLPLRQLLRLPALWTMMAAWFLLVIGVYGINFWLPTLIRASGVQGNLGIGLYSALPYVGCAIGMIGVAGCAERAGHKHLVLVATALVGGLGLIAGACWGAGHLGITLVTMTVAMTGAMTASALFWSLPGERLSGRAAAAGIAAINAIGNLGGFAGPSLLGAATDWFGSARGGLAVLGLCLFAAGVVVATMVLRRPGSATPVAAGQVHPQQGQTA